MLKKTTIFLFLLSVFSLLITVLPVEAYDFVRDSGLDSTAGKAGFKLLKGGESGQSNVAQYFKIGITILVSFQGVNVFIEFVKNGIKWMTAAGNEEKITDAKKAIVNAIIGTVIVFAAYAISYLLIELISRTTIQQ